MASPKLPEKVWRHREQNPGAGFRQSSNPEGKCESLIKFNGKIAGGSDSGIHHFSIYLPARTPASGRGSLDMQPEKVTHLERRRAGEAPSILREPSHRVLTCEHRAFFLDRGKYAGFNGLLA